MTTRPIFHRLPQVGYQDNLPTDWLTQFWDSLVTSTKGRIDALPVELWPDTALESNLDFLGALLGFNDGYWETAWDSATKRALLSRSLGWLWPRRGTFPVLRYIVTLFFGTQADVWTEGTFYAEYSAADRETIGNPLFRYFVRLPLRGLDSTASLSTEWATHRDGPTWSLATRLNALYGPAFVDSDVVYEEFYAEFSAAGDPVFTDSEDLDTEEPVTSDASMPYLL